MSETEEPESPKPGRKPVKPLPRLWKTEPESDEDAAPSDRIEPRLEKGEERRRKVRGQVAGNRQAGQSQVEIRQRQRQRPAREIQRKKKS